jgi:myosin heavy subunit
MITLDVLSEAAIQDNIRQRYQQDKIYTYIGPILLTVNPYRLLNIYGRNTLAGYVDTLRDASEPHLYQV